MEVWYLILSLLLILGGYFALVHPEDMISVTDQWRYRDAEPTPAYVLATRFGGALGIASGLFFLITLFF